MSNRLKFKTAEDGIVFYQAVKQFIRTSKKIEKLHDIPYSEKTQYSVTFKKDLDYHEQIKETAIALISEALKKAVPADGVSVSGN